MANEVPDTKVIKASLALRAKYQTKRQAPRQNLRCLQVVPHPKNRGGEPIRTARTKTLAGDILYNGYDPTEATVDSVVVEVDADGMGKPTRTFADHFQANVVFDPDQYIDRAAVIEFAGLSHNSKNLCERNIKHGMPGCNCDPPPLLLISAAAMPNPFWRKKEECLCIAWPS